MRITLNKALALDKMLRERLNDIKRLRSESALIRTTRFTSRDTEETITPTYDIKDLDIRAIQLQTALFEIDAGIKEANARTEIAIEANLPLLLSPLT
jgi:hypothetical protein